MERLNPHTCSTFWKVSGMMLLFIAGTSYLSNRCHENNSMSRKHILKFTELLRSAMEHSIKATQDTNSVTKYRDVCVAKVSIDILVNMLTPCQLQKTKTNYRMFTKILITTGSIYSIYLIKKNHEKILFESAKKYVLLRSKYIWSLRSKYVPNILKTYIDKMFKVDSHWADLNSSTNLQDRVFIENAKIMSHEQQYISITEEMNDIVKKRLGSTKNVSNGTITLNVYDIFELFGYIQDRWRLSVTYTSHSDLCKQKEAKTFTVVYNLTLDQDMKIRFPPYPIDETPQTGFKAIKVRSVDSDVNNQSVENATEYAGLHVNFYSDCP